MGEWTTHIADATTTGGAPEHVGSTVLLQGSPDAQEIRKPTPVTTQIDIFQLVSIATRIGAIRGPNSCSLSRIFAFFRAGRPSPAIGRRRTGSLSAG